MAINNAGNTTGSVKSFYITIGILLFVIIGTLSLMFYNNSLQKEIDSLETKKSDIVANIENIKSDEKVTLYHMVENNKIFLEKKTNLSKIDLFINTLKDLSTTYDINFIGFSYSDGKIQTNSQVSSDKVKKSFDKVYTFMDYLRNSQDHLFTLNFVDSFMGQDTIEFNTVFNLR